MATKQIKHRYLQLLGIIVMVLAVVRLVFPGIAGSGIAEEPGAGSTVGAVPDTTACNTLIFSSIADITGSCPSETSAAVATPAAKPRIVSYAEAFPDSNHVQLEAARQWGVSPVKDRKDAVGRKSEVVFMGSSPYYDVAHLDASIPYLVPHAAILLEDIGRAFFDSLHVRRIPLHRMLVSSVLRTQDDVARLMTSNKNATENSCHLYGTTFDIRYNTFTPLTGNCHNEETLKRVLAEVLNDMRWQGRCYVKYERRQPCFHITVR